MSDHKIYNTAAIQRYLNGEMSDTDMHALELAATPTRLKALPPRLQDRLINWGYAITDVAIRKHVDPSMNPSKGFPYPASGI